MDRANLLIESVVAGKSPRKAIQEGYGTNIDSLEDALGVFDEVWDAMSEWEGEEAPEDAPASYDRDYDRMMKAFKTAKKEADKFYKKHGKYLGSSY